MTTSDERVAIPCPKCSTTESILLYRHYANAALMCPECEHIWQVNVADHLVLQLIPPTSSQRA